MNNQNKVLTFNGKIDINEFIFDQTDAEKKLEVLNGLGGQELRKTTDNTILRIYKECRGKDSDGKPYDRFIIDCGRRVGNNWNSTIEFIYEYNGKPYLCLYVQNSSTDSSSMTSYRNFNSGEKYHGYCENLNMSFTYSSADISNVIRCILKEYVYWKYIEKSEREKAEKFAKIAGWKILNPVYNYFYEKWDCWHRMEYNTNLRNAYYAGKKAVEEYAKEHAEELYDKPVEELHTIYKQVFQKAANW